MKVSPISVSIKIYVILTCVRVEMLPQMCALLETLATHGTGVPSVTTVYTQNVSFNVRVAREQLQANAAGMFITDLSQLANIWVLVVLLVLMCLEHDPPLDGFVAGIALVWGIQIFIIRCTW